MSKYETHKATATGKAVTLQRRTIRAVKYANAAVVTRSGHTRKIGA